MFLGVIWLGHSAPPCGAGSACISQSSAGPIDGAGDGIEIGTSELLCECYFPIFEHVHDITSSQRRAVTRRQPNRLGGLYGGALQSSNEHKCCRDIRSYNFRISKPVTFVQDSDGQLIHPHARSRIIVRSQKWTTFGHHADCWRGSRWRERNWDPTVSEFVGLQLARGRATGIQPDY